MDCGYQLRSNKASKYPECTKCRSHNLLNVNDLSDEKKIEKLYHLTISRLAEYTKAANYINELLDSNDLLVEKCEKLQKDCDTLDTRYYKMRDKIKELEHRIPVPNR